MTADKSDRDFADRVLRHLPRVTPPPGFDAKLLATYETGQLGRARGPLAALAGGFRGFSETLWPGAPAWAPASALAASLLLGAGLGAAIPAASSTEAPVFSLERTGGFNLLGPDLPREDLE